MFKRIIPFLALSVILSGCKGHAYMYNRLGNMVGSVQAEQDSATITDAQGVTVGRVQANEVRDPSGEAIGKLRKREGLVLIESEYAVGYLQHDTDCYDAMGLMQGRLTEIVDPEGAAGACLLLILKKN